MALSRYILDRLRAGSPAGVAYTMSGEGIGPAIFSGLADGDCSAKGPRGYPARFHTQFARPYPKGLVSAVSSAPGFLSRLARTAAAGISASRRYLMAIRDWHICAFP